ncbi:hypothetical protein Y695_01653 [Hydrogenophaga sp. T4]|jgi:hypothetical protein|nr:hypothetical protein Y695_01653 [Hydrogenophaga sp. T4]
MVGSGEEQPALCRLYNQITENYALIGSLRPG